MLHFEWLDSNMFIQAQQEGHRQSVGILRTGTFPGTSPRKWNAPGTSPRK